MKVSTLQSQGNFDFYHPQMKLWEGNVFTPVCQSFCSQGGQQVHHPGQVPPWAGIPPEQVTPWAGIPPGQVHPTGQVHPLGRYTPWTGTQTPS